MAKNGIGKKVTRAQIIEVIADPSIVTMTAKAEELGIARKNLYERINRDPAILDEANDLTRRVVRGRLANVYSAILNEAEKGNVGAARLIFEAIGEIGKDPTGREDDPIHYVIKYDNN